MKPLLRSFHRLWDIAITGCFLALCLRVQVAAIHEAFPSIWPTLIFQLGIFVLGCVSPAPALFAFAAFIPAINGIGMTAFGDVSSPLIVSFSALFLGASLGDLVRLREPGLVQQNQRYSEFVLLRWVVNLLITVVLISLALRIFSQKLPMEFASKLLQQTDFGFGDPLYFVTSAYLWLAGLFFFRRLLDLGASISEWITPTMVSWVVSSFGLFLFQFRFHIPEGTNPGYFLPYEDISSFGSISVCLFIFTLSIYVKRNLFNGGLAVLGAPALLIMIVVSWSRATWLAAAVFLVVVSCFRLPKLWTGCILTILAGGVLVVNLHERDHRWLSSPYLSRLVALGQIESPLKKSPSRIDLYHKALEMIVQRPMTGHGIGSFYLSSRGYARPGDPLGNVPDFAHDVWLQIAAELGIPTAIIFIALFSWVLWQGWVKSLGANRRKGTDSPALALTLALGAYLLTQVTANSLNVYSSNQLIFWFLMAAVVGIPMANELDEPAREQQATKI